MKKLVLISLTLLLLIIMPGCFTFQTTPPVITPPVEQPSVIGTFSSYPTTINSGGTSTLLWNVTGANYVSIDQGIGLVDATGIRLVSPTASTTYTITATNSAGTVTRTAMTTVNSVPPPPTPIPFAITNIVANTSPSAFSGACPKTFTFSATITANGPGMVTYRWERNDGAYSNIQSVTFYEAGTKTATLQWNLNGSSSGWHRVRVLTPYEIASSPSYYTLNCDGLPVTGAPIIGSFIATSPVIALGGTSTLSWSITGATAVLIDQGIGTVVSTTGTRIVNPTVTTTYTLTASNSYGTTTSQVSVFVGTANGPLPVIVSFTANPSTIGVGQYSHLSYIIQEDPTSVIIDQGIGPVTPYGIDVGPLTATTQYTITASNSAGTVTRTVTVTVQ